MRARAHGGPEQTFVGPRLSVVLGFAGARLDSLAELASDFTPHRVILAHTVDGHALTPEEGPWRVVVEGELRPARWVRQVSALRLRAVPE